MHLSPDEIERRAFAIEDRGYDRDEVRVFLREVASALRLALHTTRPPTKAEPPSAAASPGPGTSTDDFARLGAEVAEVLRSAHDAVAGLHRQADLEIAARQEEAAVDADEIRRQAEVDATWTNDRAKRVLITAQEQADAIVAEAETTAADVLATARRQAREHADQVATRTRRHAEQILRAEREALRRLHQAQAGVAAAVEMLTGSETRPVVDLTELRPNVRLGPLSLEGSPSEPTERTADGPINDPVARMIRSAVERAAHHANETAPDDPEAGPAADRADPVAADASTAARPHETERHRGARHATEAAVTNDGEPVAPVRVARAAARTAADPSTPAAAPNTGAVVNATGAGRATRPSGPDDGRADASR